MGRLYGYATNDDYGDKDNLDTFLKKFDSFALLLPLSLQKNEK